MGCTLAFFPEITGLNNLLRRQALRCYHPCQTAPKLFSMDLAIKAEPGIELAAHLVLEAAGVRRVVPITTLPFTLGRSVSCHLAIAHPQVSREHACIERDAGGYLLRDTGSSHGTRVNGILVTSIRLRSGDQIALGTSESNLLFESEETPVAAPQPAPATQAGTTQLLAQLSHSRVQAGDGQLNDLETLALFLKAAQSLNTHGAIQDVLRSMLEYTIRLTGAERGFVFLGDSAEAFTLACGQDKAGHDVQDHASISRSIVRDAAASEEEFILSDTTVGLAAIRESVILHAIRSVVAIPLRSQNSDRLLGLLYLDSRLTRDFTNTGKDILRVIARQAAILLENMRMIEAERESVLLRKELEIAAAIQQQIIPQKLPIFPGVHLDARTIPCTGVGGDFYDVIPVSDGFVAIVGDVCGKGIPAALLGSMVQGMIYAQITSGASLLAAVSAVNSFLCARAPREKYLTLVILRYTRGADGEVLVELINGGHVCPLIVRGNSAVETIADGDLPVGLLASATFHTIPIKLEAGDRIVLLSDGISEAEDCDGTQFGYVDLASHLAARALDSMPFAEALFQALNLFCKGAHSQDDQTVFSLHQTA